MAGTRGTRRFSCVVLAVYTALAVLITLPVWLAPASILGGTGTDPHQMRWFLGWMPYALTHGQNPFITSHLNAPQGANLLWNTAVPLAGLVLWPVTTVWNATVSYNVLVTASMAAGAWCAFLFIRRQVHHAWAAAVGGLLFGFSPMMIGGARDHAQVVASAICIPLIALCLDEALVRQRWAWWLAGLCLGIAAVAQFFVFEEYFATAVLVGALLVVVVAAVGRAELRRRARHALRAVGVAAAVAVALLAFPLWLQLRGPDVVHGAIHPTTVYVTDAVNFLVPTQTMLVAPSALQQVSSRFPGNLSEQMAYLGIPLIIVLVAATVWLRRNRAVQAAAAMALLVAIASLGPRLVVDGTNTGIPLPWIVPEHLPLLDNVLPSRLMMYVFLAAGLLLALLLDALWLRRCRWWEPAYAAAFALALLLPRAPLTHESAPAASGLSDGAVATVSPGATVYAIPFPGPHELDAMDLQLDSGYRFKLVGGYFLGPPAPGQDALAAVATALSSNAPPEALESSTSVAMRVELSAAGVDDVMLTRVPNQGAAIALLSGVFGQPAAEDDGVYFWPVAR
ncbi:MAG: hypothetical protein JOY68_07780 [Candidatus Dormibacteraeota bacterium]|nr:hypothetical protein [Candidatus Dormibacteraeota bacterium]MBV8444706.1 hypothetical protein [Candidatus Dormibacteraeota bacterium]